MENKQSLSSTLLKLAELLILLILPLPFLHLNVIYVISALVIMILAKYLRKEKWSSYGFLPVKMKFIIISVIIGVVFGYADNYVIEPLVTKLIGVEPDLSTFENVKGNVAGLITLLAIGWIVGGFFEEFFFRGYLFNRIRTLVTNPLLFKIVAITLTSVVFAFAHNYQGLGGIVGTFYFAVIMGLLYFYFGKNVWYLVIIHGLFDTVGIFKLYLGH
jgi:uncharacterized protein